MATYSRLSRRASSGRISLSSVAALSTTSSSTSLLQVDPEDQDSCDAISVTSGNTGASSPHYAHQRDGDGLLGVLPSSSSTRRAGIEGLRGSRRRKSCGDEAEADKENTSDNRLTSTRTDVKRTAKKGRVSTGSCGTGTGAGCKRGRSKAQVLRVERKRKLARRASEDLFHLENMGEQTTVLVHLEQQQKKIQGTSPLTLLSLIIQDELDYELEGASESSPLSVRRGRCCRCIYLTSLRCRMGSLLQL